MPAPSLPTPHSGLTPERLRIESLATPDQPPAIPSPLLGNLGVDNFVDDMRDRILADTSTLAAVQCISSGVLPPSFETAGPRKVNYWTSEVRVAIVTCGGVAPGLNNVIQSLVNILYERYGVRTLYGVPYGYYGFEQDAQGAFQFGWRRLDPSTVQNIDNEGGSVLGTGRGHSDPARIVDALVARDINILFTLGGDGTLSGASEIYNEIKRRGLKIAIIGIPKTIDNDIVWVSRSFGFETAVAKAAEALRCAQTEARSAFHGIGLVKIMGRNSGAMTAAAAAATSGIDFVIIPEIPLQLKGEKGFLNVLVSKVLSKGHATIALAEGAGQNLFPQGQKTYDASGNAKLDNIGRLLQDEISSEFKVRGVECNMKYIDPSYILRAQPTSPDDASFCALLGQHGAHAAMAGKTGLMIGYAHECFIHVPLPLIAKQRKCLDTDGPLWQSVLSLTGQPGAWE